MLPNIKYRLTNWVDGMKIHRQHFTNSENAQIDAIRDIAAVNLTNYNFGLLYPAEGEKRSLEINILRSQSDNFKISVPLCRAITAGGCRIEITPMVDEEIICQDRIDTLAVSRKDKNAVSYYLAVLTVDPFNKIPTGEPSPEESPPRNPFARPSYELYLVAEDDIDVNSFGAFHFPIARFKLKARELAPDENFIPPCAVIQAHPGMIQLYNTIGTGLNKLQESCTDIVRKVIAKNQTTPLAQNIRRISEVNVRFISSAFFRLRMMLHQLPPIYLAEAVCQLANEIKVTLDFMPDKEKEELLNYFKEWNEVSPATFTQMLGEAIDLHYNHNNIYETFVPVLGLLQKLTELFEQLSRLDLIGKRRDKEFLVRERDVDEPKQNKKFNPLN